MVITLTAFSSWWCHRGLAQLACTPARAPVPTSAGRAPSEAALARPACAPGPPRGWRSRRPPPPAASAHPARFPTEGEPWRHFSGLRDGISHFGLRWATV